jgi:hypothetical protein
VNVYLNANPANKSTNLPVSRTILTVPANAKENWSANQKSVSTLLAAAANAEISHVFLATSKIQVLAFV